MLIMRHCGRKETAGDVGVGFLVQNRQGGFIADKHGNSKVCVSQTQAVNGGGCGQYPSESELMGRETREREGLGQAVVLLYCKPLAER